MPPGLVRGYVAFYPACSTFDRRSKWSPGGKLLTVIGDKDDWTPAALCQKVNGMPNFEVAVFPDSYHAFVSPMGKAVDYLGHHIVYNEKAALDAQQRADAFMDAHLK